MGYYLQALIGHREILEQNVSDYQHARVVLLKQDLAIIPLTDELYEEIGDGPGLFYKLSASVEAWAEKLSAASPVAYIEAEFFGGVGTQNAMAWSGGSPVLGPVEASDAINQALRLLGVQASHAVDEFDAVGLGRHRDTADWIQAIG